MPHMYNAKRKKNNSDSIWELGFSINGAEVLKSPDVSEVGCSYKHYQTKDELMGIACKEVFIEFEKQWNKTISESLNSTIARKKIIVEFLSGVSRNELIESASISGLAIDIAKQQEDSFSRLMFDRGIENLLKILRDIYQDLVPEFANEHAVYDLSCMVGASILANAMKNEWRERFLEIAESYLNEN